MQNAGLDETQAGIQIARRNISNLRNADDTTLMVESEEVLKILLMKVKVESEKVGLKLNIQKTKIMASGPITSCEIDGKMVETVSDFIWGAPKSLKMVTAAMKLKDTYTLELKVRKGSGEEIALVQGKEQWLHFAGAAVKRYPMPKIRETQVRW